MEYIDVVDENGTPAGEIKERSEIHRDGSWHRAVHVLIINDRGEVLLQKRSATIDLFQNLWDISLAGHVRSGEKSEEAVRRELKEELGIIAGDSELKFIGTVASRLKDGEKRDNQFCDIYLLHSDIDMEGIKKQTKEVAEVEFVPLNDFKRLVRENSGRCVPRAEEYEKIFDLLLGAE